MAENEGNGGGGDQGGESGQGGGGNATAIASRLKGDFDRVFNGGKLDTAEGGKAVRDNARGPRSTTLKTNRQSAGQRRNYKPSEADESDDPELEGVDDAPQRRSDRRQQQQPTRQQQQPQRTDRRQQDAPADRGQRSQQRTSADQDDDQVDDGEQGDQDGADDSPTVHPLLRDAAKRTGWDDDEIDDHIEAVGVDRAERDFQRLFDSLNSVAAQFGRLGGAPANAMGQILPAGNRAPQMPQNQQDGHADLLHQLFGDDVERFDDVYGEGFTQRVINPILENVVQPFQQLMQQTHQQQAQALANEVGQFFDGQKDFAKTFGAGASRTREQSEARWQVGQLADQIRAGAQLQGVQVSVADALNMAMRQFVAPQLQEQTRKRITDQIRTRSRRITARPTQRTSGTPNPGEAGGKNRANAVSAVAQAMDELGIDGNG